MYQNQFDKTGECSTRGGAVEDLFEHWLQANNNKFRRAERYEQFAHIDFVVYDSLQNEIKVEVKAPKKVSRSNSTIKDDIVWVEFKNVNGCPGWLYGKSDYIAFYKQDENKFYLVKTTDLKDMCEQLCIGKAYRTDDALYKRYTRFGRQDEISMIKFDDIKKLDFISFKATGV